MIAVIRTLVIDDSAEKRDRVVELLNKSLPRVECRFDIANDYNSAISKLQKSSYDLVILDLLLPLGGGAPSLQNSEALISLMMSGGLLPVPHVIGLTEFPSTAIDGSRIYAEHLLCLEVFSWDENIWAERIAAKIGYLIKSKLASLQFSNNNFETDLLILTARYENEFKPILKRMKWESKPNRKDLYFPGYEVASGRFVISNGMSLRTNVICVGEMGIAPSSVLASQAISIHRPRIVAMLGMCCGFSDVQCASPSKLGDVIVAREAASWEEGKYIELVKGDRAFFRKRPIIRALDDTVRVPVMSAIEGASDHILPFCSRFLASRASKELHGKYLDKIREKPEFKLGMLVSGSSVIADEQQVREILVRNPAAIGLDMEVFGVYTAAQKCLGQRPSVIGIKGVADFGTAEKHDDVQEYASVLSLFALLGILNKCYRDDYISMVQN